MGAGAQVHFTAGAQAIEYTTNMINPVNPKVSTHGIFQVRARMPVQTRNNYGVARDNQDFAAGWRSSLVHGKRLSVRSQYPPIAFRRR